MSDAVPGHKVMAPAGCYVGDQGEVARLRLPSPCHPVSGSACAAGRQPPQPGRSGPGRAWELNWRNGHSQRVCLHLTATAGDSFSLQGCAWVFLSLWLHGSSRRHLGDSLLREGQHCLERGSCCKALTDRLALRHAFKADLYRGGS